MVLIQHKLEQCGSQAQNVNIFLIAVAYEKLSEFILLIFSASGKCLFLFSCRTSAGLTTPKTVLERSLRDWPQTPPKYKG